MEQGQRGSSISKLNNVLMQMRKNCNHPDLITSALDPSPMFPSAAELLAQCGKMQLLDRLLKRLKAGGHKVLIFSQVCPTAPPLLSPLIPPTSPCGSLDVIYGLHLHLCGLPMLGDHCHQGCVGHTLLLPSQSCVCLQSNSFILSSSRQDCCMSLECLCMCRGSVGLPSASTHPHTAPEIGF